MATREFLTLKERAYFQRRLAEEKTKLLATLASEEQAEIELLLGPDWRRLSLRELLPMIRVVCKMPWESQ